MMQLMDTANRQSAVAVEAVEFEGEDLGPIYRFDRRFEDRVRTTGWAQVLCSNPYCTFLGGSKEMVDFSQHGLGILSECEIPVGEVVEVRVAPFKVRGKMGYVSRCEMIAENEAGEPRDADGEPRRLYKVGISFHRACSAA